MDIPACENLTKKITVENKIYILDINDIIYIESNGHYLQIHLQDNTLFYHSKLIDFLPGTDHILLHTHQSYAVNMNYIKEFGKIDIELHNGQKIPVSRNKFKEAKGKFVIYLEK